MGDPKDAITLNSLKPIVQGFMKIWIKKNKDDQFDFWDLLQEEWIGLLAWISSHKRDAAVPMLEQFVGELSRLPLLGNFYLFLYAFSKKNRDFSNKALLMATDVMMILNGKEEIGQELIEKVKKLLSMLQKEAGIGGLGVTEMERIQIVKAIGLTSGHWYKCENDHFYAIGECGGAMEEAVCPECRDMGIISTIGGTCHRVAPGNQLAREMDGATESAYPGNDF